MELEDLPQKGFVPFTSPVAVREPDISEAVSRGILPEGFTVPRVTASALGQGSSDTLLFPTDEDFLDGVPPWAGKPQFT